MYKQRKDIIEENDKQLRVLFGDGSRISFESKRQNYDPDKCQHNKVYIDEDEAFLTCRDCGEPLNPIHWLYRLHTQENLLDYRIDSLRELAKKLENKTRTKCQHCGKMTNINY